MPSNRERFGTGAARAVDGLARTLLKTRRASGMADPCGRRAGGCVDSRPRLDRIRRSAGGRVQEGRSSKRGGFVPFAGPMPWTAEFWAQMRVMVFEPFWARFGSLGAGPFPGQPALARLRRGVCRDRSSWRMYGIVGSSFAGIREVRRGAGGEAAATMLAIAVCGSRCRASDSRPGFASISFRGPTWSSTGRRATSCRSRRRRHYSSAQASTGCGARPRPGRRIECWR